MSSLSIQHLHKSFANTDVLQDISLDIQQGDFLVLVGPSGCGKSTLLSIIAGLETMTSGDIYIDNELVNEVEPSKRNIAMVFQSYALYPNMTVEKNLSFGLEMHGVPKQERQKRIQEVADILQIKDYLSRKPSALSGGQRQRVAMGRALVRHPQIFLFDEPLSNLDAKLRLDMRTEIKRLYQRLKVTFVYVTHDQVEAMTLSTKIAVMNKGIIQQLGTPNEIYNQPKNVFVAQFMGAPPMNIIPGALQTKEKGKHVCIIEQGKQQVEIPIDADTELPASYLSKKEQPILLGIRPEAIIPYDARKKHTVNIEVTVDLVEPAGADCFVILSLFGNNFTARMRGDFTANTGDTIRISFEKNSLHFFAPDTEENILIN